MDILKEAFVELCKGLDYDCTVIDIIPIGSTHSQGIVAVASKKVTLIVDGPPVVNIPSIVFKPSNDANKYFKFKVDFKK